MVYLAYPGMNDMSVNPPHELIQTNANIVLCFWLYLAFMTDRNEIYSVIIMNIIYSIV